MVNEAEMVIVADMTAQFGKAEALRRAIEAAISAHARGRGQ
jgi:hypothetical protein